VRPVNATPIRRRRVDALILGLLTVPLVVERVALVGRGAPTSADETLYLMQALDWLGRIVKVSSDAHRTWGVSAMLTPLAALTDSTTVYRIPFAVGGIALCAVVYTVGRQFLEPVAAGFAALMLGLFGTTLLGSVQILPDLPAAIGVATAFLFYWRRVVHAGAAERPSGLWPIGVAIGGIFYFNIAFAAFAAATLLLDFVLFRRRDLFGRVLLGPIVALGLVVGPYFAFVVSRFGNPLHTISLGLHGVGVASPRGEHGYDTYARWFFDSSKLFGPVWGALVLAGIAGLVFALIRGVPIPRRDAATLALWLVVPTIATAVLFHAEVRYLLPWLPAFFLALALPVQAVARWVPTSRTAAFVALIALLTAGATQFGVTQYRPAWTRTAKVISDYRFVHRTAERIARSSAPPCRVFTRFTREFELHTGCRTARYDRLTEPSLMRVAETLPQETYFVWWSGLVGRDVYQPPYLDRFLQQHADLLFAVKSASALGTVFVYRFVPTA
jgi:4-amino-4-deoxy-L-arabinose transferase-like glycosyltransferase